MKKLRSKKGETLLETLVSIVIIALSSVIIMTASLTAARINRQARESQVQCGMSRTTATNVVTAAESYSGASAAVKQYKDSDTYYFYDKG
jgi:type II secretory pathway pseudopilin PulG